MRTNGQRHQAAGPISCDTCGLGNGQHADQCPKHWELDAMRAKLNQDDLGAADALLATFEARVKLWRGVFMMGFIVGLVVATGLMQLIEWLL